MVLIEKKQLCKDIAIRWNEQYQYDYKRLPEMKRIYDGLLAMKGRKTPKKIAAIIGNDSWTRIRCHECKKDDVKVAVQLGEEPDYESSTATICVECLRDALRMSDDTFDDY
jgi:hypothetical protein